MGERSVAVSADKMNVFYAGVENPLSVSAAGVPSDQVLVSANNGLVLEKISNGKYRINAIPNPVVMMGNKLGGEISAAEIKVHQGLRTVLENFDFDALCRIQSFEVTRAPKGDEVRSATNRGASYQANAQRIINQARRKDVFYFDKIKVRCPGDDHNRTLNSLIFHIK